MRTFTAAIGLIGVLVSTTAMAQGTPPADGTTPPPAETTPPPAEASPPPSVAAPGSTGNGPQPFGPGIGPSGPSVWGILAWAGYGAGARYMIPVPITQILTRTRFRDYWAVEFGADIVRISYDYGLGASPYSYTWTEVVPVVGMMWQVWFNDSFAAYPKVELGYAVGWYSDNQTTTGLSGGNHFYPSGTAGILYKVGGGITLRAEAGNIGAKGGISWLF
jgi:hypothetical protein